MTTVSLWTWDMGCLIDRLDGHWMILSASEQDRAKRYATPLLRSRFVTGRGMLRQILAQIRGEQAGDLVIKAGRFGKPYIDDGPHFNLSHSDHHAMLAIACFPVGVDIEMIRPVAVDVASIAFSSAELAQWDRFPKIERDAAFYRGWTRKEAIIKACGASISILRNVEVSLDNEARALAIAGSATEARSWQIRDVSVEVDRVVAVAARKIGWTVTKMGN